MSTATPTKKSHFHLSAQDAIRRAHEAGMDALSRHIIEADCLDILPKLPAESVDLIHTSPPYNIAKEYKDTDDDRALSDYRQFLQRFIGEAFRVLKPNGSLFFQTGYSEDDGDNREIYPIDMLTYSDFKSAGFQLWDRIIWRYFGGMSFRRKFKNQHETILWWVRPGANELSPYFDVDAVREESKSHDKRNNLWGKNPGNIWTEDRVAYGSDRRATSHIAIYPESISERIVRACSREGELVLDPFAGSGTTPAVARSLGRAWIGIELSGAYSQEACKRIGTRQPSEWKTLCSGLIKVLCFENRPGSRPISKASALFQHWINRLDVSEYRNLYDEQISRVFEGGDLSKRQNKDPKPDVWQTFEDFLTSAPTYHPMALSNHILDALFRHRRHWNAIRKFEHSVRLLEQLLDWHASTDASHILSNLAANEPTSLGIDGESIRFMGPEIPFDGNRNLASSGEKTANGQPDLFTD